MPSKKSSRKKKREKSKSKSKDATVMVEARTALLRSLQRDNIPNLRPAGVFSETQDDPWDELQRLKFFRSMKKNTGRFCIQPCCFPMMRRIADDTVGAMKSHPQWASIQALGCRILHDLAKTSPTHKEFVDNVNGQESILAAMEAHPEDAYVQTIALLCLCDLPTYLSHRSSGVVQWTIQVLWTAIANHPDDAGIQHEGHRLLAYALNLFPSFNESFCVAKLRLGMKTALRAHTSKATVQISVSLCFGVLLRVSGSACGPDASSMVTLSGIRTTCDYLADAGSCFRPAAWVALVLMAEAGEQVMKEAIVTDPVVNKHISSALTDDNLLRETQNITFPHYLCGYVRLLAIFLLHSSTPKNTTSFCPKTITLSIVGLMKKLPCHSRFGMLACRALDILVGRYSVAKTTILHGKEDDVLFAMVRNSSKTSDDTEAYQVAGKLLFKLRDIVPKSTMHDID